MIRVINDINITVLITLGPEYGTTEAAWKGILTESERVSELHMTIKDKLCNEIIQQIRQWQKDNYHKVYICMKCVKKSINMLIFFSFSPARFQT